MSSITSLSISKKLFALVIVNAIALFLFVWGIWLSYGRIEKLSTAIAKQEMALVLENSELGRKLSVNISEIDRVTRNCRSCDKLTNGSSKIIAQLSDLAKLAPDHDLTKAIDLLATATQVLLNQCHEIGIVLSDIAVTDKHLLDELNRLEDLTSRALIEETLAGKKTDYLDQIMALVVGYRETIMLINRVVDHEATHPPTSTLPTSEAIRLIDDLRLLLQTITTGTPKMTRAARHMRSHTDVYREQVITLRDKQGKFESLLLNHRRIRNEVLNQMRQHDLATSNRAGQFNTQIHELIAQNRREIVWGCSVIGLLTLFLAIWFVRRSIQRPLFEVLQQIAAIRSGSSVIRAPSSLYNNEWGIIQSALSEMEADLAKTHALLQQVIDTAPIRIFWKDHESRYLGCNPPFAKDAGKQSAKELVGQDDFAMGWVAEAERYRADDKRVMDSGQPYLNYEEQQTTPDNQKLWLRTSKVPLRGTDGKVLGVLGIYDDITERKKLDDKLQLAATVFTHANEGILITTADGEIIDVNDAFSRITGYAREEVIGRNSRLLKSGLHGPEFYAAMWSALMEKGSWEGEIWNRRKNGELYAEWLTISTVRDNDGQIRKCVGLFSDITQLKEHEKELEHIAHHDPLTDMPNRVLLADRLQKAMAQTLRRERKLAVAYLDLDGFKAINDTHGHQVGDQLLIAVSERLHNALREGDTLARIGGDEFVAVLIDLEGASSSAQLFSRLLEAASAPINIGDLVLQVSASIGVCFYPQAEEVGADQLLRQADQAMYLAKNTGKNRYHILATETNERS